MSENPDAAKAWELTPQELAHAIYLYAQKPTPSFREIARILGRDHQTISKALRTNLPQSIISPINPFLIPLPLNGIKVEPVIQFRRHSLLWQVLQNPFADVREISTQSCKFPFGFSRSTVSRLCQAMGLNSTHTVKIPAMTQNHKKYREKWCREIQQTDMWHIPWLFTDEVSVQSDPNRASIRRVPEIFLPSYCQEYTSHPTKVMVWGAIAQGYKSPLMRITGNVDQGKYQEMLKNSGIFEAMNEKYGRGGWLFMDDGAPAHRAQSTRQFLSNRCRMLTKELQWPPHSPDLNVIENAWSFLKTGMEKHQGMTVDQLYDTANRKWEAIRPDEVENLVQEFKSRVQACAALKGGCLNGHRNVIKAFARGFASGEAVAAEEDKGESQVRLFIGQSKFFFEEWRNRPVESRLQESITIVDRLPERTKQKLGMPHGYVGR
jgi:Mn-dependent DtxR family transcriptional regulator